MPLLNATNLRLRRASQCHSPTRRPAGCKTPKHATPLSEDIKCSTRKRQRSRSSDVEDDDQLAFGEASFLSEPTTDAHGDETEAEYVLTQDVVDDLARSFSKIEHQVAQVSAQVLELRSLLQTLAAKRRKVIAAPGA